MENIEENVVTKGAKPTDPMPSSGIPVEDLGGLHQKTINLMTIQQKRKIHSCNTCTSQGCC